MPWTLVFEQLLNGVQLGVTLFLMAAGLTLVLGIMNLVNLAHGSLYMVGAYLTLAATQWTGSYLAGVALGLAGTLVIGMLIEVVTLRALYDRDHLDQVLATFGLILFFNELVAILWGRASLYAQLPDFLRGHVELPVTCGTRGGVDLAVGGRLERDVFTDVTLAGDAREVFRAELTEEAWKE